MPTTDLKKSTAKFPSFNWIRGVSDDTRISVVHRLVLIRILIHRQNDGRCNPGYQTVADELNVDRATVFRAVDAAIRRGWIANFQHGGRTKRNFEFTFPTPKQSQPSDGSTVAPERPLQGSTVAGNRSNSRRKRSQQSQATLEDVEPAGDFATTVHLTGKEERAEEYISQPPLFASLEEGQDAQPEPDKKTKRKAKPKASADLDSFFEEFWPICPKKVGKEKARKALAAAIKRGADRAKIIAAIKRYASERAGKDPTYTKHPATWLNDGCYDDEPGGDGLVIDQDGNVVAEPQPRRSGPSSADEIAEELIRKHQERGGW